MAMPDLTLVLETAALILAAYLVGCVLGYSLRLVLFAARGRRVVTAPALAPQPASAAGPRRTRSPAARLAMAASDEELPSKPVFRRNESTADRQQPRPMALDRPRDNRPDDLKQIKGIGPKIEASLHSLGIFHFDQIAAWSKADADWIDAQLGFKGRVRRERWIAQAADLARVAA